jgi:hypothetical protein
MPSNDELRAELEKSIEADQMTEEFARMVCGIALGHIHKHFKETQYLHDDFMCAFHVAIVENWNKIDPNKNIHAYISRMVSTRALNVIRSEKKYARRKYDARMLFQRYF